MKHGNIIALLVGVPLLLLIFWVANNTYWADISLPMPPKGEAAINPFYAAQRFAEALGARAAWDRVLTVPPADSVIVLSGWHWSLSRGRREALERWVESGGRLVVDRTLVDIQDEFERWSGITREYGRRHETRESATTGAEHACRVFEEESRATRSPGSLPASYVMCDLDRISSITSNGNAAWVLRDASSIQVMRVQVGRGSVTVINANPFRERYLLDGDHGRLFVAATQLRRGDDVHFLSEEGYPWLLALAWRYGAPVVALTFALVGLALWRGVVRFGPLAAPQHAARRSLAEQIRGTGRFALRHGSGESLHAACVRALDEAAQRRIKMYANLPGNEHVAALARLTGFEPHALAAAVHYHPGSHGSQELRRTIALVEAARRHMLIEHTRTSHGTS